MLSQTKYTLLQETKMTLHSSPCLTQCLSYWCTVCLTNAVQAVTWTRRLRLDVLGKAEHETAEHESRILQVEIQRMWQRDDKTLAVRWSVQCSPRLISGVTGSKIRLDGICEYKFNDAGKVVKHTVDVINWNGLHNALGLRPSLLGAELMPTPSCFSNNSMNYAENC